MLITSHLAATMFLADAFSLRGTPEIGIAFVGGILLDCDHLFVNKKWISDIRMFFRGNLTHGEVNQHSWMQEPLFGLSVGVIVGILLSTVLPVRWWIFPFFQAVHIVMDAAMRYEHRPFVPFYRWAYRGVVPSNSKIELVVSSLLLAMIWLHLFSL